MLTKIACCFVAGVLVLGCERTPATGPANTLENWRLTELDREIIRKTLNLPNGARIDKVGVWGGKDRSFFIRGTLTSDGDIPDSVRSSEGEVDGYLTMSPPVVDWYTVPSHRSLTGGRLRQTDAYFTLVMGDDESEFFIRITDGQTKVPIAFYEILKKQL